jgi:hypothetical protein
MLHSDHSHVCFKICTNSKLLRGMLASRGSLETLNGDDYLVGGPTTTSQPSRFAQVEADVGARNLRETTCIFTAARASLVAALREPTSLAKYLPQKGCVVCVIPRPFHFLDSLG